MEKEIQIPRGSTEMYTQFNDISDWAAKKDNRVAFCVCLQHNGQGESVSNNLVMHGSGEELILTISGLMLTDPLVAQVVQTAVKFYEHQNEIFNEQSVTSKTQA